MATNYDDMPRAKRLTAEEMERHITRLTAPRQPADVHDPFEVCPTKHLSADELNKMTDRLYTQSLERRAASMAEAQRAAYGSNSGAAAGGAAATGGTGKLTPEQEEQAVARLYSEAVQSREAKMSQLKQQHRFNPKASSKKVPLEAFVQHMYTDRLEAKKKTEQRLHDMYIEPTEIRTGTLTREQAAQSADRLSTTKAGA